jgi:mannose-6-phosphate isomerase class I
LAYIRKEFGENITQDETYYILDSKDDAKVYLGFQDDICPEDFREELETSKENNQEIQIDRYVQSYKAQKHELFLIPNGTIHSAGANNLVLEISATPYIFTFKMYDWLRMDLNGEPRAINIEHAFNNLNFERKGKMVQEQLISKPTVLKEGADFKLVHLPTHKEHFYDVHRLEFNSEISIETNDACHVLMLVEGTNVLVKTAEGMTRRYNYAETFVIPAAAKHYTLINGGEIPAKVIKAFLKDDFKKLDDEDENRNS